VIVLDASALANIVADDQLTGRQARARLSDAGGAAIPDLADVETVAVLRKRWLAGDLSDGRFRTAVDDLLALPLARFPVGPLMRRAYELRANVTAYDAAYIALAEGLACPLVTGDARLAAAPGVNWQIELLVD
jgi:predicted nucleic acid-binding protein